MADPVSLSIGLSVLGGAVGGVGSIMGGNAKAEQYRYQAGIARQNELIQKQNANFAREAGGIEAEQAGMKSRARMGAIRAGQGASNLAVNEGSAVDVQDSQMMADEMDQRLIRRNAARRAFGFDAESANAKTQAGMFDRAAEGAETAGMIGGLTSFLGSATSVAGKWYDASRMGLIGGPKFAEDNKW